MKKVLFKDVVGKFEQQHILVVGDVMLDRYVFCSADRISAEAPVPVLKKYSTAEYAGGAANVAVNLKQLGAKVTLLGVVGSDFGGKNLGVMLRGFDVSRSNIIEVSDRMTTVKTRIMAADQQVLRIDEEMDKPLSAECVNQLKKRICESIGGCTGVIISDYSKGVISQELVSCILKEAKKLKIPVAYDPKRNHALKMSGLALVTPNTKEAYEAMGLTPKPLQSHSDMYSGELVHIGRDLIKKWGAKNVMLTMGEQGMWVFSKGKYMFSIASDAKEVRDVTGAGDTVVATALLALASGANIGMASRLASYAAGVVVGKYRTAHCRNDEIENLLKKAGVWEKEGL